MKAQKESRNIALLSFYLRYLLYGNLFGPHGRVGREGKITPEPTFFVLCLYFIRTSLFWLSLFSPFVLVLQHTHSTNIQVPRGIGTRSPIKRAAAQLCFRPPGRWDRQEFDPRTAQPVASRIAYWAISAPYGCLILHTGRHRKFAQREVWYLRLARGKFDEVELVDEYVGMSVQKLRTGQSRVTWADTIVAVAWKPYVYRDVFFTTLPVEHYRDDFRSAFGESRVPAKWSVFNLVAHCREIGSVSDRNISGRPTVLNCWARRTFTERTVGL